MPANSQPGSEPFSVLLIPGALPRENHQVIDFEADTNALIDTVVVVTRREAQDFDAAVHAQPI